MSDVSDGFKKSGTIMFTCSYCGKETVWPCTMVCDRYGGVYSEAKWLAFNLDCDNIPVEINGSDPQEIDFFMTDKHKAYIIGKGETPRQAYNDLIDKLVAHSGGCEHGSCVLTCP